MYLPLTEFNRLKMLYRLSKSYKEQGRRNSVIDTLDDPAEVKARIYAPEFIDGVVFFRPEQAKLDALNEIFNETVDLYKRQGEPFKNGVPSEIHNTPYYSNTTFYSKEMFGDDTAT